LRRPRSDGFALGWGGQLIEGNHTPFVWIREEHLLAAGIGRRVVCRDKGLPLLSLILVNLVLHFRLVGKRRSRDRVRIANMPGGRSTQPSAAPAASMFIIGIPGLASLTRHILLLKLSFL
jgi:hypothetical protein